MDISALADEFNRLAASLPPETGTAVFIHPSIESGASDFAGARALTEDFDDVKHQFTSAEWNEQLFICFREPDVHQKFGLILCAGVFSAAPDPNRVMAEIARLADEGGNVIIAEPINWFSASARLPFESRIKTTLIRTELKYESSRDDSGWLLISAKQNGSLLDQFFHEVELQAILWDLKKYLAPFFSEWLASGKRRIAFWGAGEQFEQIVEQLFPMPEGLEMAGVVDSDAPQAGKIVCGYKVHTTGELMQMAPDVIVIASHYYQEEIYRRLEGMGLADKAFRIYSDETIRRPASNSPVALRCHNITIRPSVLVVCYAASVPLIKRFRSLKGEREFNLILITYQKFVNTLLGKALTSQCDETLTFRNYGELKSILETTPSNVIHAVSLPTLIPAICLKWGKAPVVVEMYDTCRPIWEEATIPKADLEAERFITENAAAIVHKDAPLPIEWLASEYSSIAPRIQIMPGVDLADCVEIESEPKLSVNEPIRLVHAGTLWTSDQPARKWAYGQFIRWIPSLLAQGMAVDVFPAHKYADEKISDYIELQNKCAGFKWHEPHNYSEMIRVLGGYHFGLNVLFYRGTTAKPFNYSSAISTKLFSYIEAGIPVIINKEHVAMADIVRRYGIGIIIGEEDIPSLRAIIESCDYAGMKRNIIKAREELDVRAGAEKLLGIYSNFLPGETKV